MKIIALILLIFGVAVLQAGCSSSSNSPLELTTIEALKAQPGTNVNHIRFTALKQAAMVLGSQAGLAWRAKKLNGFLEAQKRNLDHIFDFSFLILNQNVLPPVLVEGRDTLDLTDDFTIRASDHDYKIVQQPRFVTAPPNWRHYIWMGYVKPEIPNATILPKGTSERRIWNKYIQIGWSEGVLQADQIFASNLARLQRDYEGIILYRKLLAQKMLSKPYVSEAELGVTGGGDDMRINDRVLRITAIPQLQPNTKQWNPVIAK